MNIQPSNNYLFSRDGQQYGPFDGDYLQVLAKNGQVIPTDHVWTEGMAEWVPAIQFAELNAIFAPPQQAGPLATLATPAPAVKRPTMASPATATPVGGAAPATKMATPVGQPRATPQAGRTAAPATAMATSSGTPRSLPGAKFGLIAGLFIAAMAGFVGFLVLGGVQLSTLHTKVDAEGEIPVPTGLGIAGILYVIGLIASLALSVLTLIYVYRAWKYIQDLPGVTSTPGKAIGFMFIPFFNLYWLFIAYWGWSKDYNRRRTMTNNDGPEASEGLFMVFCILTLIGLSVFVFPPVMAKLCKAVNHLATSPELQA